jgi:uncharacterized protein
MNTEFAMEIRPIVNEHSVDAKELKPESQCGEHRFLDAPLNSWHRWRRQFGHHSSDGLATLSSILRALGFPPNFSDGSRIIAPTPYVKLALSFAFMLFIGFAAVAISQRLSLANISGTNLLPVATFGSVLMGSVAAGLAGFAFSAITGSLLLHWLAPTVAVPLLLACSITTQLFSIAALWNTMQWKRCLPLLIGGFLGIPLGTFVLQHFSAGRFNVAFGAFLLCYAAYMLLRPNYTIQQDGGGSLAAVAIGFGGGVTGGAIAFPGALPTIWCSLRALPKEMQRGTVQPFILVMQVATLAYLSKLGILGVATGRTFLWCSPAVLAGTWIGVRLFRHIDDAMFRRVLLVFLLFSGAALM